MDLITGLFCIGFACITSYLIYLVLSISSNKNDSFDEAKANRRKMLKQIQDEKKISCEKAKEKKNRKAIKKSKELLISNSGKTDKEMNEQIPNVKEENSKLDVPSGKGKKSKQVQQIDVKSDGSKPAVIETNIKVKEDVNKAVLNKATSNKDPKKKKNDMDVEKTTIKVSKIQETVALISDAPKKDSTEILPNTQPSTRQQGAAKLSKKKRFEITSMNQLKNEREAISITLLVSLIQKAELSRSEIQMLIDALLNKQQDDVSEWLKGRQDPVAKLKKHISDNEQALKNEKEINVGLQAKLRELRAELTTERITVRNLEENISSLQTEAKAFANKLQTVADEKQSLNLKIEQVEKQLKEEQALLQHKEDQILKQRMTEEEGHKGIVSMQKQVAQLTTKLQENVRVIEEYQKMQGDLSRAFEGAQFKVKELQNELETQNRALTDAKTEVDGLILTNKNLYEQNEHLTGQLKNQCQEINLLREKNESLAKVNAENWENGFSYNNKQGITEFETKLEEQSNQIDKLSKELEFSRNKVHELNLNLNKSKNEFSKNVLLLEKSNNDLEKLKEKFNDSTTAFNKDLEKLNSTINEKNKEIVFLSNEIEICKQRNDTLRNKNWKIAEALTNTEKALQTKLRNEQSHTVCAKCESNLDFEKIHETINRLMTYLNPDVIIEDTKDDLYEMLSQLEDTVIARTINGNNKSRQTELQTHNSRLEALVLHYKNIITDTERMLNKLQSHVEVEEAKWKKTIKALEQKVAKLQNNHVDEVYLES